MKIGERGQVTIPKAIRERLGLGPETEVEFSIRGSVVELRKAGGPQREAIESLYGRKSFRGNTDELLALLRE